MFKVEIKFSYGRNVKLLISYKLILRIQNGLVIIPVFRRYKTKNGAKTQINGYASFLFVFQLSNNW